MGGYKARHSMVIALSRNRSRALNNKDKESNQPDFSLESGVGLMLGGTAPCQCNPEEMSRRDPPSTMLSLHQRTQWFTKVLGSKRDLERTYSRFGRSICRKYNTVKNHMSVVRKPANSIEVGGRR